jgi:hypothetical protein
MDEEKTLNNNQTISDGDTGSFPIGKGQETPSEMRLLKMAERYGPLHTQTASVFLDLFRTLALSRTCDAISLHQSNMHWNLPVHKFRFFSIAACSYLAMDKEKYDGFFLELFGLAPQQSSRLSEMCSKYEEITMSSRVLILASEFDVNLTLFHVSCDGGLHSVSQSYKPDRNEALVAIDDEDTIFRIVPQVIGIDVQYITVTFQQASQIHVDITPIQSESNSNQDKAKPIVINSLEQLPASSMTPSEAVSKATDDVKDTNKEEKMPEDSSDNSGLDPVPVEGVEVRSLLHLFFSLNHFW